MPEININEHKKSVFQPKLPIDSLIRPSHGNELSSCIDESGNRIFSCYLLEFLQCLKYANEERHGKCYSHVSSVKYLRLKEYRDNYPHMLCYGKQFLFESYQKKGDTLCKTIKLLQHLRINILDYQPWIMSIRSACGIMDKIVAINSISTMLSFELFYMESFLNLKSQLERVEDYDKIYIRLPNSRAKYLLKSYLDYCLLTCKQFFISLRTVSNFIDTYQHGSSIHPFHLFGAYIMQLNVNFENAICNLPRFYH